MSGSFQLIGNTQIIKEVLNAYFMNGVLSLLSNKDERDVHD